MKCGYHDITDRLGTPIWWDEYGVPRYCDFSPLESANIYARQVALVEISCQACGHRFPVCFSSGSEVLIDEDARSVKDGIIDRTLFYGDPPNWECCGSGATMTSETVRVLQCWERDTRYEWVRLHALETYIGEEEA